MSSPGVPPPAPAPLGARPELSDELNGYLNMTVRLDEPEIQLVTRFMLRLRPDAGITREATRYCDWLRATPVALHPPPRARR
jgi:hypothetical protein